MPIIVNMPGGGLDSAGQGVAAAQGFRANEQRMAQIDAEAMRRNEAFEFDKKIALRGVELRERESEFQMEQLAQQQEAEADVLVQQMIEAGMDVGDGGASHEMVKRTSPQFRRQMSADLARATRIKAEQQQFEGLLSRIQNTPELAEIQQQVESGQITSAAQLRNAVERGERQVAEAAQREADRARTMAEWEKWQADPGFDMPSDMDDAHEDVMKRLSKIIPGGGARGDVKYREVLEELKLLTNRGSREAARRIAMEEFGPVLGGNQPTTDMMLGVAKDEAHADHIRLEGNIAKWDAFRKQTNEMPNELYDQETGKPVSGAASEAPGENLKKPLEATARAALYGAGPDADTKSDVETALGDLGFDVNNLPRKGEPGYETVRSVVENVMKRRAAEKPEDLGAAIERGRALRPSVADYAQMGLSAAIEALTPTQAEMLRNRAAARGGRGVRSDYAQKGLGAAEKPKASIGAPLREGRGGKFL